MTNLKKSIYEKLGEIQKNLKAPKGRYNSFSKFYYRSCEDILEAVKPLLDGMVLIVSDEMILVGARYYVKATAVLSDGDCRIEVPAYAREPELKKGMDEAQITGATSSYARKYALNGMFAIDDAKDADADEEKKVEEAFERSKSFSHVVVPIKKESKKVDGLSDDQIRSYEITFGKFTGLTLHQIAAQTTEGGDAKGIAWMEWLLDQNPTTEAGKEAQQAAKRYLNEVVSK